MSVTVHQAGPGILKFALLSIVAVSPPEPVENEPIAVAFTLLNAQGPGVIQYAGPPDSASSPIVRVDGSGNLVSGTVYGLAPAAGSAVTIQVDFIQDQPGVEFPPVTTSGTLKIDIKARYTLSIDWFEVGNPRGGPDTAAVPASDLVVGVCTALYGDQPLPLVRPLSIFDTQDDEHGFFGRQLAHNRAPTYFQNGPFEAVPGKAPDVKINYIFTNASFVGSSAEAAGRFHNGLSAISRAVVTVIFPGAADAWKAVDEQVQKLDKVLDCDGVVAADNLVLPSELMAQVTADTGAYAEVRHYPGLNSPIACGEASNYYVRWSIRRESQPLTEVVVGPFGGSRGVPFEQRRFPGSSLIGCTVHSGEKVDAIMLNFTDQRSLKFGGTGGTEHSFNLQAGEYIWGIKGRAGGRLDSITFLTNMGEFGPFGGTGGQEFQAGEQNLELVGLFGHQGDEIDALGAIFRTR